MEGTPRTLLEYWPPHPSRGTGYHRIVFILLRGALGEGIDRHNYKEHLRDPQSIVGYSFFRTCWTKSVLGIIGEHKGKCVVFIDVVGMKDEPLAEVAELKPLGANPKHVKGLESEKRLEGNK